MENNLIFNNIEFVPRQERLNYTGQQLFIVLEAIAKYVNEKLGIGSEVNMFNQFFIIQGDYSNITFISLFLFLHFKEMVIDGKKEKINVVRILDIVMEKGFTKIIALIDANNDLTEKYKDFADYVMEKISDRLADTELLENDQSKLEVKKK